MTTLKDVRLTEYFTLAEATWSDTLNGYVECKPHQLYLHKQIAATITHLFRDPYGKTLIKSGQRNTIIHKHLKQQGYKPSKTSDHFFADTMNYFATGAWDVALPDFDIYRAFMEIYKERRFYVNLRVKEIIYYEDRHIVHVANSPSLLFNHRFSKEAGLHDRNIFYISPRHGKYKPYRG